jgi:hypothetical protein
MNKKMLDILILDRDDSRRAKLKACLSSTCDVTDLKRPEDLLRNQRPIESFDIALIHARDAEENDGELEMVCYSSPTPVILFSGGFSKAKKCENNVWEMPDDDLLAHCLDGIKVFTETGAVNLTALTLGYGFAKKQVVAELCKILREPVISGRDQDKMELVSGKGADTIKELRALCLESSYQKQLDGVEEALHQQDWANFLPNLDRLIELIR